MVISALTAVSWKTILVTALPIAREARLLYKTLSGRRGEKDPAQNSETASVSGALDKIATRLDEVDADQEKQAGLLAEMAAQEEALSRGLQALSARLTVLLWVSSFALVLALIAIVIAVVS
jgi:hypothetical protein